MPRSRPAQRDHRRNGRKGKVVRPAGPIFIALTLLVVLLLAANLIAFYVLHAPPAVTLAVLAILGLTLLGLGRYRRKTIER